MLYAILVYNDPAKEPAYGTPEFDAMMEGFSSLAEDLTAAGAFIAGEGLQGVETATSVQVRSGKVATMDGPFAETREHLGGFYLIDVPDLDKAIAYAARVPAAAFGTVEVRPVMSYAPAEG